MKTSAHLIISYLSLVQTSILYCTIWFIQWFKCVTHVFVPQPGLFFIWNTEDFPYFFFNCIYMDRNKNLNVQVVTCIYQELIYIYLIAEDRNLHVI